MLQKLPKLQYFNNSCNSEELLGSQGNPIYLIHCAINCFNVLTIIAPNLQQARLNVLKLNIMLYVLLIFIWSLKLFPPLSWEPRVVKWAAAHKNLVTLNVAQQQVLSFRNGNKIIGKETFGGVLKNKLRLNLYALNLNRKYYVKEIRLFNTCLVRICICNADIVGACWK